jgi:superfamily II DNA/RNA helicase
MPEYDNMGSRQWNALWNAVTKADKRNAFIADLAKKDLAANYRIVIPVKRIAHLESLREVFIMEGVVTSEELAVLSGRLNKKDRANMVDNIRAGKYKVVIAIDKLVSLGFNAPPLSCIYMNVGSYHFDMNNAYQEYSRVRTAYEGKNKPMIRIMKDDGKISNMSTTKLCKEFERLAFNNKDEQDEEPILDIVPSSKGGPVRTKRKFSI